MILKRPYAFLVKHFRLIHAILFACTIFIFIKFNSIVDFFNTYIDSNLKIVGADDIASKYVGASLTFTLVVVLIITGIVMYLMIYKKKPKLMYIYVATIFLACLIAAFYLSGFLYDIQFNIPDLRGVKVLRDILFSLQMLLIPIMIMTLIRMIGFDIKKFDFKRDLLDLGVTEEDNEEYVFDIDIDSDEFKSNVRKKLRYTGYYIKENKLIFTLIIGACILVVLLFGIVRLASMEKIYREGESFKTSFLKIEVLESYKTNVDATGDSLSDKNFYLILKLRYKNITNYPFTISTENALLNYGGVKTITPTMKMAKDLTEFGVNYYSQTLDPHEERDFVLIYEIPNEYYKSSFKLKYLYDYKMVKGVIQYQYRTVKISPKTFTDDTKKFEPVEKGKYLTFKDSLLGNTKIRINEIKTANVFYYNVVRCKKDKCTNTVKPLSAAPNTKFEMTLMRIDYDIVYDYEKLGKDYVNNNIISDYGSIRFEVNGKEYNNRTNLTNVTPYDTGKYVFIEVREKVNMADKIYLDLTIRDKVYTIVLYDKAKKTKESE